MPEIAWPADKSIRSADPLGMEGGEHPGWAGHALFPPTAAAVGWRAGCLQAGARTATSRAVACRRGRRKAVRVTVPQPGDEKDDFIFSERGGRSRGRAGSGGGPICRRNPLGYQKSGGFADNI